MTHAPAGCRPTAVPSAIAVPDPDDKPREECGVFGVFGAADSAALTALGLHALQHRGQEGAGIVACDGQRFHHHRALGLVGEIFSDPAVMERLAGQAAVGHVRYSTSGEPVLRNVQPLYADFHFGGLAIANNGNLTNARHLRRALVRAGSLFHSTTDTEVFQHIIATAGGPRLRDRLLAALRRVEGAFALVALSRRKLIGARDPLGIRPLVLGRLRDAWVLASETCAFDIIGARPEREVAPGELVIVDADGLHSHRIVPAAPARPCVFEHIYFARPDSMVGDTGIYESRQRIGAELARETNPPDADMVVPVPDSGVPAALGYAARAGIPFELGLIRNHYVGRTFIEPTSAIRHLGVRLKHNANMPVLRDRHVVLVDDSIVRGTTSRKIVDMVRQAGAAKVHFRVSSPPAAHSCFYGINTPAADELLAHGRAVEQMRQMLGADSLAFLSLDGLYRALDAPAASQGGPPGFCDACFTGVYPTPLTDADGGESDQQLSLLAELS